MDRNGPAPPAKRPPGGVSAELKQQIDEVLEATIYLYTESRRLTKEIARRVDLTGPQLTVVKILEAVGGLSLSELSSRIRAQNSTVTGIIDRMEREGLVVRARSQTDRRVVHIHLTEKGTKLAREIPIEPMRVFRTAIESLTDREMKDLFKTLNKVARFVKSHAGGDGVLSDDV